MDPTCFGVKTRSQPNPTKQYQQPSHPSFSPILAEAYLKMSFLSSTLRASMATGKQRDLVAHLIQLLHHTHQANS
eukprot:766355-Amphidinium_carterae.1